MPHSITFKAIQHETHFFVELTSMPIPASNVFFSTSHSSVTRVACSCGQHSTASIRRVAPKVAHSSTPSLFWLRPRRHCRCSRVEPNVAHSSIRLLEPLDPSFFAEIAGTRRSIATRMASTFLYAVTAQNDSRQCCLVIGVHDMILARRAWTGRIDTASRTNIDKYVIERTLWSLLDNT